MMSSEYRLRWLEEKLAKLEESTNEKVARAEAEIAAADTAYERVQRERQARLAEQERTERDPIRAVVEHAQWVRTGVHPAAERIREAVDPTPPAPPTQNERPTPRPFDFAIRRMQGQDDSE